MTKTRTTGLLISLYSLLSLVQAGEWSGYIASESRYFFDKGAYPQQLNHYNQSLSAELSYHHDWDNGHQSFSFTPFLRWDQQDKDRNHADIREFTWLKAGDTWEWRVGIRKVFWGVTESSHLVDIINQNDQLENIDGEDKLGQAMINFAWIQDWGTLDLFVLPGFRPRQFTGLHGRLRPPIAVDDDLTAYESSAGKSHTDWAIRWSHSIGDWELGVSHFAGTSRIPTLLLSSNSQGQPVLAPYYPQIQQTGLDLQWINEAWLWKLETIYQHRQGSYQLPSPNLAQTVEQVRYYASTAGFEYSFYGLFETDMDLGVIMEYAYDDRGDNTPHASQDDVFLGFRLAVNNPESTDLLIGISQDRQLSSRFLNIEANHRLSNNLKLNLESRFFSHIDPQDPFSIIQADDYIRLELTWYF